VQAADLDPDRQRPTLAARAGSPGVGGRQAKRRGSSDKVRTSDVASDIRGSQGRFKGMGTGKGSRTAAPAARPRAPAAAQAPSHPGGDGRSPIQRTVVGLGYELVDVERVGRGLLRVTIDRIPGQAYATGESEFVLVEDCERVTRQLQYALEVEGVDYARLEVSSPGLDRPLKSESDYARFAGLRVDIVLKLPFDGRKHFQGELGGAPGAWTLTFGDPGNPKAPPQQLGFTFDEVREARLVPVLNFKGRAKPGAAAPQAAQAEAEQGESEE
jgi:ribosome maturation factor RimP